MASEVYTRLVQVKHVMDVPYFGKPSNLPCCMKRALISRSLDSVIMLHTLPNGDDTTVSPSDTASPSLVIGNIHVLYNPKCGDIKLGQMRIFLQKAYKLSQEWGLPVVITGDLNSLPQSAMYQFLASSELHTQQHDRRKISGQICPFEHADPNFGEIMFGDGPVKNKCGLVVQETVIVAPSLL